MPGSEVNPLEPFCRKIDGAVKKLKQMKAALTHEQGQYLLRYAIDAEYKIYGSDGVMALILSMPDEETLREEKNDGSKS